VVLDLGLTFLPPFAVGGRGLEGSTAVDPAPEIAAVLLQGGGGEEVATFVDREGAQEHRLQAWRKPGIPRLEGKLTIPDWMG
jgi:hypothetical protein